MGGRKNKGEARERRKRGWKAGRLGGGSNNGTEEAKRRPGRGKEKRIWPRKRRMGGKRGGVGGGREDKDGESRRRINFRHRRRIEGEE